MKGLGGPRELFWEQSNALLTLIITVILCKGKESKVLQPMLLYCHHAPNKHW